MLGRVRQLSVTLTKLGEHVELGGSYAEDRNTASPYKLYGAHADVQLAEQSLLTMGSAME